MASENVGEVVTEKSPTNPRPTVFPQPNAGTDAPAQGRLGCWNLLRLASSLSLKVIINPNSHKFIFSTLFQFRQAVNNDFALEVAVE